MTKRKFSAGWYAGSVREAKRQAFIAGAEAVLDVFMKEADRSVKKVKNDGDIDPMTKSEVTFHFLTLSKDVYAAAIDRVIARTPFEPPTEDQELLQTEREPDTADRTSK